MTLDWILGLGTIVFGITTWATLSFGYARFREYGRRDSEDTAAGSVSDERVSARPGPE